MSGEMIRNLVSADRSFVFRGPENTNAIPKPIHMPIAVRVYTHLEPSVGGKLNFKTKLSEDEGQLYSYIWENERVRWILSGLGFNSL